MLGALIEAAEQKEKERSLLPLWLARYAIEKLKGNDDFMTFAQFLEATESELKTPAATPNNELTAEEIMKEFAPIIAADQLRSAKNGEHI